MLAVISPRWRAPAACEACGGEFTCGASVGGCWCAKVEVNDAARAHLRAKFSGCVCRACLDKAQEQALSVREHTSYERTGRLKAAPTTTGY